MKKILILFAHPAIHKSRINKKLIQAIEQLEGITVNDLYEKYPDFFINIKAEQDLLLEHDIIVWHHPFYWYSCPAIIKEWMDLVLEHGFAYGINGNALEGKKAMSVISTGGKMEVYCNEGSNHYTINQFLIPFHQSAELCKMEYLPPFIIHGSHMLSRSEINEYSEKYKDVLLRLRDEKFTKEELKSKEYINWINNKNA